MSSRIPAIRPAHCAVPLPGLCLLICLLVVALWVVFLLESIQRGGSLSDAVLSRFGGVTSATFPDGVAFVPLASLIDPNLMLSTIADTLGVGQAAEQQVFERTCTHLRGKRLLLVLEKRREEVAVKMVDRIERQAGREGQRLREIRHADQFLVARLLLQDPVEERDRRRQCDMRLYHRNGDRQRG